MLRSSRIVRDVSLATLLAAASIAIAPPSTGLGALPAERVENATVGSIAAQLGVKVVSSARVDDEFTIGMQFTGLLVEPEKLAAFGVKGMRAGARVAVARFGLDRIYIEADEMDPPRRESTRVTLDSNGKLVRPLNA